jgi:hypothetical protein
VIFGVFFVPLKQFLAFVELFLALKINSKKTILPVWAEPVGPTLPIGPASGPAKPIWTKGRGGRGLMAGAAARVPSACASCPARPHKRAKPSPHVRHRPPPRLAPPPCTSRAGAPPCTKLASWPTVAAAPPDSGSSLPSPLLVSSPSSSSPSPLLISRPGRASLFPRRR